MPSILIVIPTYNEAENLPILVPRLMALDPPVHVLAADDASPDGTGAIGDQLAARFERFRILHRSGKRGYARACAEGMAMGLAEGYDLVCTMDADLSHDANDVPRLIAAVDLIGALSFIRAAPRAIRVIEEEF